MVVVGDQGSADRQWRGPAPAATLPRRGYPFHPPPSVPAHVRPQLARTAQVSGTVSPDDAPGEVRGRLMLQNDPMDQPSFDVLGFLHERRQPASVATVTSNGRPALAMMWFVLDEGRLWFHTPTGGSPPSPHLRAAAEGREVAVMIATFNPPDDVRQVRMSGSAQLEDRDEGRVRAIYGRYIDAWTPGWHEQATSTDYHLWSMVPERGMAVTYPGLEGRPVFRWSEPWM